MKSTYDVCLPLLLAHEGGYSNHPSDPGGPTNFGITIFDYRKYVNPGATAADVRAMTVEEAKRIYRARYWDAQRCDELPAGLDYAVFDYGINSGIGRSAKVLRRLLGLPDRSVTISDDVIGATHAVDPTTLVSRICDERLRFLRSLRPPVAVAALHGRLLLLVWRALARRGHVADRCNELRWDADMGRLLERVGEADQRRLVPAATDERHADGQRPDETCRHRHVRVARDRGRLTIR